ncbi:maleylpyruvate isomerase family mycothiol-dependent enzyme [Nitriliruptoraceae bacterium ZYF776]|nr:maleylpyruvate isomerase family mycothiol-dependent enzyme [Profundirhabdus halotolerans]
MTDTLTDQAPPIGRDEARRLATTEYQRLARQLRSLTGDDWTQPTDCELWDVRDVAGHCVGMLSDFTSLRAVLRRMRAASRAAKRDGRPMVDAMTAMQVAEHAEATPAELVALVEQRGPIAARWRTGTPRVLRAMPMQEEVGGRSETWRLGYLFDTILTRDPWMHRVDIARATGRDLELTADHDGRIVADVVAEWARRHGRPFELTLTGPAGGRFAVGAGGEPLRLDAVEFCRILSGRAPGAGLLGQPVPF